MTPPPDLFIHPTFTCIACWRIQSYRWTADCHLFILWLCGLFVGKLIHIQPILPKPAVHWWTSSVHLSKSEHGCLEQFAPISLSYISYLLPADLRDGFKCFPGRIMHFCPLWAKCVTLLHFNERSRWCWNMCPSVEEILAFPAIQYLHHNWSSDISSWLGKQLHLWMPEWFLQIQFTLLNTASRKTDNIFTNSKKIRQHLSIWSVIIFVLIFLPG